MKRTEKQHLHLLQTAEKKKDSEPGFPRNGNKTKLKLYFTPSKWCEPIADLVKKLTILERSLGGYRVWQNVISLFTD